MSQSYFPTYRPLRPTDSLENITPLATPMREGEVHDLDASREKVDDVQQYQEHRDRLTSALDATSSILTDLREFNKASWVVRYPHLKPSSERPSNARRSLSFADDPTTSTEVVLTPPTEGRLRRTLTTADAEVASDVPAADQVSANETDGLVTKSDGDFHVLRLDLKLGPHGTTTSGPTLVSQLEKSSIASLLSERIATSLVHLSKLRARVQDTSSKVLVTGDLNAGKSTFVNALLRREVMPVDQQPCTTMFCEVHDAADNDGAEEAHVVKEGCTYNHADESTFTRHPLNELEEIVTESDAERILKLYVNDPRDPQSSLVNNGTVNISLIDAPGLNRDSLKTTALFARQEEIDVVVFVVSAENHFTLSAKEFLWNASNEKAYLFIVVNRFDQIRDKARCKRLVLDQIRQLSPRTWEDAADLVHFVDSASVVETGEISDSFQTLEHSLRSFVLQKREKSKLLPAITFLNKILSDLDLLTSANALAASAELKQAQDDLARARPILEKMLAGREDLDEALAGVEDSMSGEAGDKAKDRLEKALELVGKGQSAMPEIVSMPRFPGMLQLWQYTREVKKALLQSIDEAVKAAESDARLIAVQGVTKVGTLGDAHLPVGVERSKRIFKPEAMFVVRPGHHKRRSSLNTVVVGGAYGLGIGLAAQPSALDVEFRDIIDMRHYLMRFALIGSQDGKSPLHEESDISTSAISMLSVGVGAVTMVGGKTLGARGLLEGLVRIGDLFGNAATRKWAAPLAGALALGLSLYFIYELPNTIPRTVGRHIKTILTANEPGSSQVASTSSPEQMSFAPAHAHRISKETRKVMRLAAWDLRERFRQAVDERASEVKNWEEIERVAQRAVEWLEECGRRAEEVRQKAGLTGVVDAPVLAQ
ncbi:hypothetical protein DACRYDRAFT_21374 [Dacryopinax primogenitus]|uniref:Dynamin-type G domain-containing protein n=1 Tax=Dacryopinax primogenitus (strain DJM 731) TaxID=1858805 RepID=M5G2U8_DACPD|nr:uncharacterized protein DACRYDRAFT_21374 [Dacryopinax primogenitus]EJU03019.1 hypothetical protein DACRYDRAFT_21374 [Dacryopinax primogenitus]